MWCQREAEVKRRALSVFAVLLVLMSALLGCSEPYRSESDVGDASVAHDAPDVGGEPTVAQGTRVTCIDVGKGDCILVQAGTSAALIDTGYQGTDDEVLAVMREQGVDHLSALIITHYDKDHVGGLGAVADELAVDVVYLPGYVGADKNYKTVAKAVESRGLKTQQVAREVRLALGEGQLTIYPSDVAYVPDANGSEGNDNDVSLVVALTCGDDAYLFAGDLEEEGVDAYLRAGHGHFDVLKMPHHGEGGGNTDELIDDVRPSIALITDSADDPADKKVLKLLKKRDVDTYRTSECGTIVVEGDGTGTYEVSFGS